VQDFGHEMVFASPFPAMSWLVDYHPVDSIVIFTIAARFITTKAWRTGRHPREVVRRIRSDLGGRDHVR
jgi:hypothetical protein